MNQPYSPHSPVPGADRTIPLDRPAGKAAGGSSASGKKRPDSGVTRQLRRRVSGTVTAMLFGEKRDIDQQIEQSRSKGKPGEIHFDGAEQPFLPLKDAYDLGKKLDAGGQGTIYAATDRTLLRPVAVKTLHRDQTADSLKRAIFLTEARLTAQLDHPAIVPVYSINSDDRHGLHWAMKLINGTTLQTYLEDICAHYRVSGINTFDEAKSLRHRLEIFLKVCDAMEYAHSRNVMHGDLKPANIMIGRYHETYIMDWGIARTINPPPENYLPAGTPRYLAPELIAGNPGDQRADIFALGAILFELVFLKPAFEGSNGAEIMAAITVGRLSPMLHRYGAHVPSDLPSIIRKALATSPEERYASVGAMATDLRRYMMDLATSAHPDNFLRKTLRWTRKHSMTLVLLLLLGLLGTVGASAYSLAQKFSFSEELRQRDQLLSTAYSICSRAAYQLDEQFLKLEQTTELLAADIAFLLQYDRHQPDAEQLKAAVFLPDFQKRPATGKQLSVFHHGAIDINSIVYNLTADTSRRNLDERLVPLARFIPRLLETILTSTPNTKFIPERKAELTALALAEGTPVIRALFGFSDGLYAAYPAAGDFPTVYDPRKREWYRVAANSNTPEGCWTRPYVDSIPQFGLVISCSAPFFDASGRLNGICALDISISELIEELRSGGNNTNLVEEKSIITADGEIIVSTTTDFSNAKNQGYATADSTVVFDKLDNRELLSAMKHKRYGVLIQEDDNDDEIVYAYCHIPSVNWFYLERMRMESLFISPDDQVTAAR